MKKITLSIGVLLAGSMFFAGSMFSACGSKSNTTPTGAAGSGAAGTGAAGSNPDATGAAGTNVDAGGGSATTADGKCVSGAFSREGAPCLCQTDIPTVCAMGCTNTKTDNDNCGTCGTKCGQTSACVNGACTAAPAAVVPAAAGCTKMVGSATEYSISIAIAGTTLYWADAGHGTVKSQPVAGGAVTMIATGETAPHALAVAGTTPVWISSVAGPKGDGGLEVITATLRKAGAAGGAATTLATGMNEAGGIQGVTPSADGATLYYSSGTGIYSIPLAGAAMPTNVGNEDHGGLPGALALDGMKLIYGTGQNGDVDIMTIQAGKVASCGINDASGELDPAKQINCLRIARSQGSLVLSTILAKADRAYWADGSNLKGNPTTPTATQANETIATASGNIVSMAMGASKIYFVHDDLVERTGLVQMSPIDTLTRGQMAPASVAVDATKVYWSNGGDCTINSTGL